MGRSPFAVYPFPMRKVILRNHTYISPFNESARDLRILNKPLWLHQRDLLARYTTEEREVDSGSFAEIGITPTFLRLTNPPATCASSTSPSGCTSATCSPATPPRSGKSTPVRSPRSESHLHFSV